MLEFKRWVVEENKGPINVIKAKIEELKRTNNTPPATFIKKLKEYQQLVHEYNALLKEFREKKAAIAELKGEITNIQESIFNSKVINHNSIHPHPIIRPPRTLNPGKQSSCRKI